MSENTKDTLSEIYMDNRKLMLELRKELKTSSRTAPNLNDPIIDIFKEIHSTNMNQMSASELVDLENMKKISNITSQNEALKRYR